MKMRSSKRLAAMLTVALIIMSVACIAQSSKDHPHYPVPTHHQSEFRFDSKKLPRSTPSSLSLSGKASPYAREVLHLENATSSDLHIAAKNETRASASYSIAKSDLREHQHSAPINFSYHSTNSGSVSSRRR